MNVISFSLWGDRPIFIDGARINVFLAREVYPGWKVRIYCASDMPSELIAELRDMGADCVMMDRRTPWDGLFWRFLAAADPDVDVMLSRDTDSRLNWREQAAVHEWLESSEPLHIMRDNVRHHAAILGGMWGVRGGFLRKLPDMLYRWRGFREKNMDQYFLQRHVWPLVRYRHVAHDEYFNMSGPLARPFPPHRPIEPLHFVGERVNWSPDAYPAWRAGVTDR